MTDWYEIDMSWCKNTKFGWMFLSLVSDNVSLIVSVYNSCTQLIGIFNIGLFFVII